MPPILSLPVVSWLAAEAWTTPALMLNWPVQPVLSAPRTRVPVACLTSAAVAPPVSSKAEVSVTVLPAATSSWRVLAVLPKTIVRPKVRSSVKRSVELPPVGARTTLLAASPSWPSAEIESTPRWTFTLPTKSLVASPSTRVPLPVFVRPAPETLPAKVRPWVTLWSEAPETEKTALAATVSGWLTRSPYPLLFVSVRPEPRFEMTPVEMVLLRAWLSGRVPPARPTVMFGTMPASKMTAPGRTMVCGWALPSPSARSETAAVLPRAVASKSPV